MTGERPRIILEKSSTVRRRYQRSDKRFKFTAQQLKRIEREEELEKRAKDIREKEKRRIANKKKKLEQETKAREEARKQGLPDPSASKIPSSQPLLSKFLGFASRPPPVEKPPNKEPSSDEETAEHNSPTHNSPTNPKPTGLETNTHDDQDMGCDSAGGDTEAESDLFDDLDEELEQEISALDETMALGDQEPEHNGMNTSNGTPDISKETRNTDTLTTPNHRNSLAGRDDDDEFSDCSAFYDDLDDGFGQDISGLNETIPLNEQKPEHNGLSPSNGGPDISKEEIIDTEEDEFSNCSAFDDDDILKEVEAAVITQTSQHERFVPRRNPSPITRTFLQPPNNAPKTTTRAIPSLNSSFRDETADYLDDVFARGCGDSFGELLGLGSKPR